MNLEEQINADIKKAMLAKESGKLEALRAIKAALLLLKTSPEGTSEAIEIKTLQKMIKQRKETAELYINQQRKDLADTELAQATVIEAYLPKQMSEDEVKEEVQKVIQQVGAAGPGDFGKVMGIMSKQLAGKVDGKTISQVVKQMLSN
ncbi:MAG: GatB/YqeY domain-containing protein [Bacteroidia bacterium]|nr:GatB/YqeY domain-containing protein [Bacteroidia bacterium]MCZ2247916.1 GatB/YqeY domain-containing protein [Bacteroidia bacterium]